MFFTSLFLITVSKRRNGIPSNKYNSYGCLCEQGIVGEYCEKVNSYFSFALALFSVRRTLMDNLFYKPIKFPFFSKPWSRARNYKGPFTRYDFVACDKLTTGLRHELFRVNQTYNSLTTLKSCRRPVVSLSHATKSCRVNRPLAVLCKMTTWYHQNLRGPRKETPTANDLSFHLELNAALIRFAEVNLRRCKSR